VGYGRNEKKDLSQDKKIGTKKVPEKMLHKRGGFQLDSQDHGIRRWFEGQENN